MATVLPAMKHDYSGLKKAIGMIGQSFDTRAAEERAHAMRLKLLEEEAKKQEMLANQRYEHEQGLIDYRNEANLEAQVNAKNLDASLNDVMTRYLRAEHHARPQSKIATEDEKHGLRTGGLEKPKSSEERLSAVSPDIQDEYILKINNQELILPRAEVAARAREYGFFDEKKGRVVTYAEQQKVQEQEKLYEEIQHRKSATENEKKVAAANETYLTSGTNLRNTQRIGQGYENNILAIKANLMQKEQDKADKSEGKQNLLARADFLDRLTDGQFLSLSPKEQASQEALATKVINPEAPKKNQITFLDVHKDIYNAANAEDRRKFFLASVGKPKQVDDRFSIPEEGDPTFDDRGRVEGSLLLFDKLYDQQVQAGLVPDETKLRNAVSYAVKLHTADGTMPFQLNLTKWDTYPDGSPKMLLSEEGGSMFVSAMAYYRGDVSGEDKPITDAQKARFAAFLESQQADELKLKANDTDEVLTAKTLGAYNALVSNNSINGLTTKAAIMAGVAFLTDSDISTVEKILGGLPEKETDTGHLGRLSGAFASKVKNFFTTLGGGAGTGLATTANILTELNFPVSAGKGTRMEDVPEDFYPEYFPSTISHVGATGIEKTERAALGSLITSFTQDTGEYVTPERLREDIKKIPSENPEVRNRLLDTYEKQYRSNALPKQGE